MTLIKTVIGLIALSSFSLATVDYDTFNKNLKSKQNVSLEKNNVKQNFSSEKNNVKVVEYGENNQTIDIKVDYRQPTKIVFPAFIEKIEMVDKSSSIAINSKELETGSDTLLLTQEQEIDSSAIIYVTVLSKRIILNVEPNKNFDKLVKINIPMSSSIPTNSKSSASEENIERTKIKSKDLTRTTNIKSAEMILKMLNNKAENYYKEINLNTVVKKDKSMLDFDDKSEEKVSTQLFTKLFKDNPDFFSLYLNRIIRPEKLYIDHFVVNKSNKVKDVLDIYGMKTKWCNYSSNNALQITIDDVKRVFGKNILKVQHPMEKLAPRTCDYVYTVFYRK